MSPYFKNDTRFVYLIENWKATPVDLPIRRRQPLDSPGIGSPTSVYHLHSLISFAPLNDLNNHVRQIRFFR